MTAVDPLVVAIAFVILAVFVLYRVFQGPTRQDRVLGVTILGSKTVVVIALVAAAVDEPGYLDVALVFAMLNFLLNIAMAKYSIEGGEVL